MFFLDLFQNNLEQVLKIIDKYIVKQFLQTIIFGLLTFILIFVLIDLLENLDNFIDHDVPTDIIIKYYIVFIPEIVRLMLPVGILLAALFTVGKLTNQNELTAIKSSGVSIYRIMAPFIITALIISFGAIYFGGYVVPSANKEKVYIDQKFLGKNQYRGGANIYFQDTETRIVTISYYDVRIHQANRVSIQDFDSTDITRMTSRIDAVRMVYDSTKSSWIVFNGIKRHLTEDTETAEEFNKIELSDLNFLPSDVINKQRKPVEMTLSELDDYAADQLEAGNNPTRINIEYHSRISFAFSCLIVVLFSIPVSSNKRKGGLAIQMGISLMITFVYLVFSKVFEAFGKNGVLDPLITAWAANFVFLIAALINLIRAQK